MNSASTSSEPADRENGRISSENADHLPARPSSLPASAILHGDPLPPGQVIVLNNQTSLEQIRAHSVSNLQSELGGVLLGRAYRQDEGLIVEVQAALPAVTADSGPVHFTFTADAWSQIHKDKEAQYPDLDIVGWFHTHPGLQVFYSSDDVVVHTAAFRMPWHVGLVVDPLNSEACYFGWVDGELAPLAGFYELTDQQAQSVIPWRVVRTEVWQESETEAFYAAQAADGHVHPAFREQADWRDYLPTQMQTALAAGVIGLLLSLILLFGWVIPLTRQANQMESLLLTLAQETDLNAAACPDPRLRILTPVSGYRFPAGSEVVFVGTAAAPGANRYQLATRFLGQMEWQLTDTLRQDTKLGQLGKWDTRELPPGQYEVQLTAVDRNGIRLKTAVPCQITLELTK
ncbi:MAG TPA: hypothetical protein EYH05_04295 [Anaerolineae bacterium]|nr:hypothetical protein [Anaerolineae bacterium]